MDIKFNFLAMWRQAKELLRFLFGDWRCKWAKRIDRSRQPMTGHEYRRTDLGNIGELASEYACLWNLGKILEKVLPFRRRSSKRKTHLNFHWGILNLSLRCTVRLHHNLTTRFMSLSTATSGVPPRSRSSHEPPMINHQNLLSVQLINHALQVREGF